VPERSIRLAMHCSQGSFRVWEFGPLVDDNLDPVSLPSRWTLPPSSLTAWS
jgi:hypothetical protein